MPVPQNSQRLDGCQNYRHIEFRNETPGLTDDAETEVVVTKHVQSHEQQTTGNEDQVSKPWSTTCCAQRNQNKESDGH